MNMDQNEDAPAMGDSDANVEPMNDTQIEDDFFENKDLSHVMDDLKIEMYRLKLSNNQLSLKLEENKKQLYRLKEDIGKIEDNIASKDEEIEELQKLYEEKSKESFHNLVTSQTDDAKSSRNELVSDKELADNGQDE
ncbi:hypothetical protein M8J76_006974 [Diaphorina citri]|nr:hypothetical protein M8J75_002016 [Diaphorina citri]KAI5749391.1 hypothetical protein M8J76_006974 [Diaphorina citri]